MVAIIWIDSQKIRSLENDTGWFEFYFDQPWFPEFSEKQKEIIHNSVSITSKRSAGCRSNGNFSLWQWLQQSAAQDAVEQTARERSQRARTFSPLAWRTCGICGKRRCRSWMRKIKRRTVRGITILSVRLCAVSE